MSSSSSFVLSMISRLLARYGSDFNGVPGDPALDDFERFSVVGVGESWLTPLLRLVGVKLLLAPSPLLVLSTSTTKGCLLAIGVLRSEAESTCSSFDLAVANADNDEVELCGSPGLMGVFSVSSKSLDLY